MGPWAYDVRSCVRPWPSIKVQVLVDFMIERTILNEELVKADSPVKESLENQWILHVDGSLNASGSEAGLILINFEGGTFYYALRFGFFSTNNETKYEALIVSLKRFKELGIQDLKTYNDSKLIVGHVHDEYKAQKKNIKYLSRVRNLIKAFQSFDT